MGVIGEGERLGFDVATLGEVGCEVDALEAEEEGHRAPARGFQRGRFGAGFHSIPGEPVYGDFGSAMILSHSLASTNSSIETTMAAKKNLTCFLFRRISMFKSLHQGSRSYYEYLQIAKVWADQLAIVGKPLADDDLISFIINGFNPSFNSFNTSFSFATCENQLNFNDFQDELLSHMKCCLINKKLQPQTIPLWLYSSRSKVTIISIPKTEDKNLSNFHLKTSIANLFLIILPHYQNLHHQTKELPSTAEPYTLPNQGKDQPSSS